MNKRSHGEGGIDQALHLAPLAGLLLAIQANAETVNVKYRGPVDLKPFACTDTPQ